jgi:hypothetical protein
MYQYLFKGLGGDLYIMNYFDRRINIGTKKQIFANQWLINLGSWDYNEKREKIYFKWPNGISFNRISPEIDPNPIIIADKPWEKGELGVYLSAFHDGTKFRMYYEAFDENRQYLLLYAESSDGLSWKKPNLDLVEWGGNTQNNIILVPEMCPYSVNIAGNCVFMDTNPKCPPEQLFKTSYKCGNPGKYGEVHLATSPDGFHWDFYEKSIANTEADTQSVIFFDNSLGKYRGYFRSWNAHKRSVRYGETDDIFYWENLQYLWDCSPNIPLGIDYYTSGVHRWPGAEGVLVGLPTMFDRNTKKCNTYLFLQSHPSAQFIQIGNSPYIDNPKSGIGKGMIFSGNGIYQPDHPDYLGKWCFPIFQSNYSHVFPKDYDEPAKSAIYQASVPEDGFIALDAPCEFDFWTCLLEFKGDSLHINGESLSENGELKVEVQEFQTGDILPGLSLDECKPLNGRFINKQVQWGGDVELEDYNDCYVQLHFMGRAVRLYSFQFREKNA